jgi:Calcineurin-like phosphoesterase
MRQSETMRAASRLLLSHPIVCLLAALAAVVVVAVLGPLKVVYAADVTVEGENFANQTVPGTNVITGAGYNGGAALKFTGDVIASHPVNCSTPCDVVLMASGGQSGGQATFSVNGLPPQTLTSTTTTAYTFHLLEGASTIEVKAGGTGTGHNAVLDVVSFPASDGGGTDTTRPNVTIDSGPGDTSDGAATFAFSADEPATFECKLLRGSTTISNWAACTSGKTYSGLADGDYRFRVRGTDSSNNVSVISSLDFTVTNGGGGGDADGDGVLDSEDQCPNDPGPASNNGCPITGGSVSIIGAGDIATSGSAAIATGNLIDARPDARVFTAGDNAYPDGTASDYTTKYEPAWGGLLKNRTSPSPGNHEYYTSGASGYKNYFGSVDGLRSVNPTYYAYTLGAWRVYALDSNISMAIGSPQYNFVQQDLTDNRALCELAYWHHPIASSGQHGNIATARPIFELFDAQGGDLVLNGHDHNYERFTKINSSGQVSASGVREIIVGTGGANLRGLGFVQPGSEVRNFDTYGIVDIALSSTGYSGEFVPAPVQTFGSFKDTFSGTCGT